MLRLPDGGCANSAQWPCEAVTGMNSTPRACRRKFWQRDRDAPRCSIAGCQALFPSSLASLFQSTTERRHHCRMCGRVVCGSCSRHKKFLLPPEGTKSGMFGGPAPERVCDACYAKDKPDTFMWHFEGNSSSDHADGSMPDLNSWNSQARSCAATIEEGSDSPRTASGTDEARPAEGSGGTCPSTSARDIEAASIRIGTVAFNTTLRNCINPKQPAKSGSLSSSSSYLDDTDDEEDRCSQQTTPAQSDASKAERKKQDKQLALCADDHRLASLESKIRDCELYEGMVANEPQAMKALLYATLGLVPGTQPRLK